MEGSGYKCLCIDGRNGDKCQYWTGKEKVLLLIRLPESMHSVQTNAGRVAKPVNGEKHVSPFLSL